MPGSCSRFGLFMVLAATLVGLSGCASSPTRTSPTQKPAEHDHEATAFARLNRISARARRLHNPVAAYMFLLEQCVHSDGLLHDLLAQVVAATESELGAYALAIADYPQGAPRLTHAPAPLPTTAQASAENATDVVSRLARSRRLVMVNEAHHDAQTRLLTLELLPRLRKLGFNYFATEALDENDRDLASRGYPVKSSGTYIREPIYGEIIRSAIRLGYHVIAYDSTRGDATPAEREQDQADHLIKRVFDADPAARLFIHAGYAHVDKRADYFYANTLAMRLAARTGIDPLSVDQTMLHAMAPGREYPGYRPLIERFAPTSPVVLVMRDGGKPWSLEPEIYDVSVLLPPMRLIDGRPNWLTLGGQRGPVSIDEDTSRLPLPYLIEARYAGENADAVPADRELITSRKLKPTLFLRPGSYRVDILTSIGQRRPLHVLHVPASTSPDRD